MKKLVYITLSSVLGILLSFIAHVAIEYPVIWLLVKDFEKFSFGLEWDKIMLVHNIFTVVLFLAGLIFGIKLGLRWWKYIYVDKKYKGRLVKIKD